MRPTGCSPGPRSLGHLFSSGLCGFPGPVASWRFAGASLRSAGPPGIALDSQVMEGRAAIAGQGIAILNHYLWKAEVEAGLLVEAVPSYVRELASYWIVYPSHARNTPKVKAFRDWICAEFADAVAADPEGVYLPR